MSGIACINTPLQWRRVQITDRVAAGLGIKKRQTTNKGGWDEP
jgi:hypothetical protein